MYQMNKIDRDWDKEITVSLTLKELQVLYDSVGNVSYAQILTDNAENDVDTPFTLDDLCTACEDLELILAENGGIIYG